MYHTLYRKYRPNNFDEVVGQKIIVQVLKNAIKNNTLSHAYLFTGPRGTGKTSVAKILAKTINCTNMQNTIPCNICVNCTQNNVNPLDIIEIDAASNNGVDEMRELKNKINLVPALGKYKIYIIDEVHMLSIGAFNALLKTLEEPPDHVIFVLATTDPHKVPNTILSRCQRFDFQKIPVSLIVERMNYISENEKINITREALEEIANLSDGCLRDALSLFDQVIAYAVDDIKIEDIYDISGTITQNEQLELILNIINSNIGDVLKKLDLYNHNGKDFIKLAESLMIFLRTLIIKENAPNYYQTIKKESFDEKSFDTLDSNKLFEIVFELNKAVSEMKNSNNPKLILELSMIKIMNKKNTISDIKEPLPKSLSLKEIRINNTLCNFNKKQLLQFLPKIEELKKYQSHTKYSDLIDLIFRGPVKAVGNNNIIIVLNEQDSKELNKNIQYVDELFKKTFEKDYKLISVTEIEWEKIKTEFNKKIKEYKYIEEKKEGIK